MNQDDVIEPILTQQVRPTLTPILNIHDEALQEENNEHEDDENDDVVLPDNNVGDLDKYYLQETKDHSILYSRGYASELDDDGPDEKIDEEGFTTKEAEAFKKVFGRITVHHCSTILVLPMKPWLTAAKAYCLELDQVFTGLNMGSTIFFPGQSLKHSWN
ncbi:hypothetical protein D1007_23199 [Hordeum vulgare]|nr:hypothetical protein D1007_23199 [Hordeum vulgare]